MQKVANSMCLRKSGTIINILSSACLYSNEGIGSYTASKTALEGLTGVNTTFRPNTREDYLNVESIVEIIGSVIKSAPSAAIDEIIVRAFVETNFS
jgi:short-subunit dehydrogenase